MTTSSPDTATMLLSCRDRTGIVAAVASWVSSHGGNILDAEQHSDLELGMFFQRVVFTIDELDVERGEMAGSFEQEVGGRFAMTTELHFTGEEQRVALLASKPGHCLFDLLSRWHLGELPGEPVLVISNHDTHREAVERQGLAYHHLPVNAETKAEQEAQILELLAQARVDLVVLARYMQVLTDDFLAHYTHRVINIHHSFLPAFPGGRPYRQAYGRGVKIVGATAHYATADLDEGPIIEQDVTRVSHRDSVRDLSRRGRDLERLVLARGVRAHLEHRVLPVGNKTIVFG